MSVKSGAEATLPLSASVEELTVLFISSLQSRPANTNVLAKTLKVFLRTALLLVITAPFILLFLAIQTSPYVPTYQSLTDREIATIEQLLLESAPQAPANRSIQNVSLSESELNLLTRFSVDVINLSDKWSTNLSLQEGSLSTALSVEISQFVLPLFLNIRGEFTNSNDLLALESLHVGNLKVPDRFVSFLIERSRSNLPVSNTAYQEITALFDKVNQVNIESGRMNVTLEWDPELISSLSDEAQQLFISDSDKQRIMSYYRQISAISASFPADLRAVSLNALLVPLFNFAAENSLGGEDPISENRTLLQALAIYVNDDDIQQLIGADLASQLEPAEFVEVRLQRRQDLAQHLVSMAAITASAGADLARMLSTTKEAYDARYRSGFSFSDLTANTVGVSLGNIATRNESSALIIQQRLGNLQNESDYMPEVGNSRDGISEQDFNALYQDLNSPEYQQRLNDIRALINARPIFEGL